MARAFLVVIDSVGIGGAPDAGRFFNGARPDTGANTLGHIAQACAAGQANAGRQGPLAVPVMAGLGLGQALHLASGMPAELLGGPRDPQGLWGAATQASGGKDTPTGHWELAGVPVPWAWHHFPNTQPAFPPEICDLVAQAAGTAGILGNCHASGTQIIARLGGRHLQTGWPICYTSADSVFQIAAHEGVFGLQRLLDLCAAVAPALHRLPVGRVIARPFTGTPGAFERTQNRRDYAVPPPAPTLCDWVAQAGGRVQAIGKIGDIFSMQGIDSVQKGTDAQLMAHLQGQVANAPDGSLTFANFVEFDSLYGHRRDVAGYARHLEWFDQGLGRIIAALRPGDGLFLTADHGNDPTWPGTDHTRERVPVLVAGAGAGGLGHLRFVDVAARVAAHLGVPAQGLGRGEL
jgi:phosphopentomutase